MKLDTATDSVVEEREAASPNAKAHMTEETIKEWFDLYRDKLLMSFAVYIGDYHLAEDIVQEAFLTCVRKIGSPQAFQGRSNPYSWLWRLAYNHWIDALRRKKEKTTYALSSSRDETAIFYESKIFMDKDTVTGIEAAMRTELLQLVQKTLKKMSPEYAEVLKMRDMDCLGYQEIADNLSIPIGTVRSRINRARNEFYSAFLMTVLFAGANIPEKSEKRSSSKQKGMRRNIVYCS